MTLGKISDKDMRHCHFLKLTCDIGNPLSRAPEGGGKRYGWNVTAADSLCMLNIPRGGSSARSRGQAVTGQVFLLIFFCPFCPFLFLNCMFYQLLAFNLCPFHSFMFLLSPSISSFFPLFDFISRCPLTHAFSFSSTRSPHFSFARTYSS